MNTGNLITIAGIILTFLGIQSVGYMHRRQIRQAELFRTDPNVGLKPPPSTHVKFFGRHLSSILDIILLGWLSYWLWISAQRLESSLMLLIAAYVVVYVETIKGFIRRIRHRTPDDYALRFAEMQNLPEIVGHLIDIDSKQNRALDEHSKSLETLFELLGDLRKDLPRPT